MNCRHHPDWPAQPQNQFLAPTSNHDPRLGWSARNAREILCLHLASRREIMSHERLQQQGTRRRRRRDRPRIAPRRPRAIPPRHDRHRERHDRGQPQANDQEPPQVHPGVELRHDPRHRQQPVARPRPPAHRQIADQPRQRIQRQAAGKRTAAIAGDSSGSAAAHRRPPATRPPPPPASRNPVPCRKSSSPAA